MPVTLVDRLPLPNLKVYSAGSVLLLSVAVYYAMSVTSDPSWRLNVTQQRQESAAPAQSDGEAMLVPPLMAPLELASNGTRTLGDQLLDVVVFMMHEPLCMWTLINLAYCALTLAGFAVQRAVFGELRALEAQRVKDKFWNYLFYKFIFVFGVVNVQRLEEVLLWAAWFTLLGCLQLLVQLCKDRYEYLSSSASAARWAHVKLALLLGGILAGAGALLALAAVHGLPAGPDTFAFMAAECVLVLVSALHVAARYVLQARAADPAGPAAYYTHLVFDSVSLVTELLHVVHMVMWCSVLVSMASLVLLMQLRHLLHELQARLRRHTLYTKLTAHMSRNYPMASPEEVEKNQDNCAICWEPMTEARKLPCSHLFHNSCLCRWMQHDASCPTCRRALHAAAETGAGAGARREEDVIPPPRVQPNRLFRFDGLARAALLLLALALGLAVLAVVAARGGRGTLTSTPTGSRYVSWLPSFSVEVTRVRAAPLAGPQLEALARQVQAMFPQYPLRLIAADLAASGSPDLTVDNILAGRLPAPGETPHTILDAMFAREDSPEPRALHPLAPVTATPAPATPAPSPAAPAPHRLSLDNSEQRPELSETEEETETGAGAAPFLHSCEERQALLQRRKRQLLASARRNYLAKMAAAPTSPAAPAPRPPHT